MTVDPFKELREQPYDLFKAPLPYSFDLNEDMIQMLRDEFNADIISGKLADALGKKTGAEAQNAGEALFADLGKQWMSKTIQLGEEYSDRTIEVILETVDRNGEQFLLFPHVPQRFVEIAYLGTQEFMKVPIVLNNMTTLAYRIPQCALFNKIKENSGEEVANLMTCKNYCLTALETIQKHMDLDVLIEQEMSTVPDGYCQFSMRKL